MRFFILPFLLLIISCKHENALILSQPAKFAKAAIMPSAIDSLATNDDVSEYLRKIDTNFSRFTVAEIEMLKGRGNPEIDSTMKLRARELGIAKSFYKADFDNNGYSDLLVFGGWGVWSEGPQNKQLAYDSYVILNFGNGNSKIHELQRDFRSFDIPEIKYDGEEPFLVMHFSENWIHMDTETEHNREVTLTGKFGVFTEYNKKPVDSKIEKIEYEAGTCFGTCPIFKITINKDRSATFFAEHYNFSQTQDADFKPEGTFKATLRDKEFEQIVDILNYIDFKNLKEEYAVRYTDAPTAIIKITYDNGKVKNIMDYGMKGTYGLNAVYSLLADLRFNQEWVKTE